MTDGVSNPRARYIMIGGFLGAGKTTAVARFAEELTQRGLRVGLITNDQSSGLVDTAILSKRGFAVEEIAGGCFCCRFQSLSEAAERLTASARPEVFIAEPVGSCTDLVATVSYPLRRIYGDRFAIAPLSVLVDPVRAARVLGLAEGRSFSERVVYVYEKQLEEADLIVVNKCDELEDASRDALVARLAERFPRADVLTCSALTGDGTAEWFERMLCEESDYSATLEIDYQRYAEGEALLGWLNATLTVEAPEIFDANALLVDLAEELRVRIDERGFEIAHLKMTLDSPEAGGQLAAISLTSSAGTADLREALIDGIRSGELILNLRAEADPDELQAITDDVFRATERRHPGMRIESLHNEHFRPAPPTPTHRVSSEEALALGRGAAR